MPRRTGGVLVALLGAVLLVAGGAVGYLDYARRSGPEGAVRGFFQALQDGDAPQALAWGAPGAVPDGSRALLTSQVLAEQQRIAPIRDIQVGTVRSAGRTASVAISYRLAYAAGDVRVHQHVAVLDTGDGWRLRSAAVLVQLELSAAARRARLLGGAAPTDTVLLLPGAVPITFDTPYLRLDTATSHIELGGPSSQQVTVEVSDTGRRAALAAVDSAVSTCLSATGAAADVCPLPGTRFVPGSLRGAATAGTYTVMLGSSPDGLLDITGTAPFSGSYRVLTFANRQRAAAGSATLQVHAQAYATAPLRVRWVTT